MGESSALEGTTRCRLATAGRGVVGECGRRQAYLLCPAISANARFVGCSANNVMVMASLATVHKTNG